MCCYGGIIYKTFRGVKMNFKKWCTKRNKLMGEFKRIFKFDCPMDESKLFIDIFGLEKHLDWQDDETMSDAIIRKYGKEGNDIVDELIDMIDEIPLEASELVVKGLIKTARKIYG